MLMECDQSVTRSPKHFRPAKGRCYPSHRMILSLEGVVSHLGYVILCLLLYSILLKAAARGQGELLGLRRLFGNNVAFINHAA